MTVMTQLLADLHIELRRSSENLPDQIPADALLKDALGVDSLTMLEFIARVEYRYGLLVPDDVWERLTTLEDVARYVASNS